MYGLLKRLTTRVASLFPELKVYIKTYNARCKSFFRIKSRLKRLTTRVASLFTELKVDLKDLQRALQVFLDVWSIKKTYNARCKSFSRIKSRLKRLSTRVASLFSELKVD
jgi:hypothetical protein